MCNLISFHRPMDSSNNMACPLCIQLARTLDQLQHVLEDTKSSAHQLQLAEKEKEVEKLSRKVQEHESQLQRQLQQQAVSDDSTEEERADELALEVSDMRVQLLAARAEKDKMKQTIEDALRKKGEMMEWIAALENKVPVSG